MRIMLYWEKSLLILLCNHFSTKNEFVHRRCKHLEASRFERVQPVVWSFDAKDLKSLYYLEPFWHSREWMQRCSCIMDKYVRCKSLLTNSWTFQENNLLTGWIENITIHFVVCCLFERYPHSTITYYLLLAVFYELLWGMKCNCMMENGSQDWDCFFQLSNKSNKKDL